MFVSATKHPSYDLSENPTIIIIIIIIIINDTLNLLHRN